MRLPSRQINRNIRPVVVGVKDYASLTPQGCNRWKCAGAVAMCAAACATGVPACIACLGSKYDDCKDCF